MDGSGPRLPIVRPISQWGSSIDVDFRKFFVALSQGVVSGASHQWPVTGAKIIEAFGSIGAKLDRGELAWLLTTRALLRTVGGIIGTSNFGTLQRRKEDIEVFADKLNLDFQQSLLTIDQDFFRHPSELSVIELLIEPIRAWFRDFLLVPMEAGQLRDRIRSDFPENLHQEWVEHSSDYKKLRDAFDSPFIDSLVRESSWKDYLQLLLRNTEKCPIDPSAPISKCFVPIRGYDEPPNAGKGLKRVFDVVENFVAWLSAKGPESTVRVLSGSLGAGKSYVVKFIVLKFAGGGSFRPIYLPLNRFEYKDDLEADVNKYLRREGFFSHDVLGIEKGDRRILLAFDGLDDVGPDRASKLVDAAVRLCEGHNVYDDRLRVVFTARESTVATLPRRTRHKCGIVHLLPLFVPERERASFDDPKQLLGVDGRRDWCRQYKEATGSDLTFLEKWIDASEETVQLSSQPLLLHLLALKSPAGLSTDEHLQLTSVYEHLLRSIYDRDWDSTSLGDAGISFDSFALAFEEAAWMMWRDNTNVARMGELIDRLADANNGKGIRIPKNDTSRWRQFFDAFFLVERILEPDDTVAYEFAHKGFPEYLLARRFMRHFKASSQAITSQTTQSTDLMQSHLARWRQLAAAAELTTGHLTFLRSEAKIQATNSAKDAKDMLAVGGMLLNTVVMSGGMVGPTPASFTHLAASVRNADEALLAVASSMALACQQLIDFDIKDEAAFGRWLGFLVGQRISRDSCLALKCLGNIAVPGNCALLGRDLIRSDWSGSRLGSVSLRWSCLTEANLAKVVCDGADLRDCDLQGADLSGAQLRNVLLRGANLKWANLQESSLIDCDLEGADLRGVRLRGADCKGTNFHDADLRDIENDLTEVLNGDFSGAVTD